MVSRIPEGQSPEPTQPFRAKEVSANLREPKRTLDEFTGAMPLHNPEKLAQLANHSPSLKRVLERVEDNGIANPVTALFTLMSQAGIKLPKGGDLACAEVLLPYLAQLLKKHN